MSEVPFHVRLMCLILLSNLAQQLPCSLTLRHGQAAHGYVFCILLIGTWFTS